MYKYLLIAALAAVSLPAMANDDPAATPSSGGMVRPNMEQIKARMAERHAKMVQHRNENRAERDAHMDKCYNAMQGAKSPEEMKAVHQNCRAEGKAMREKNQAERKEHMEKKKAKRAEWQAKKADMKAAPAGE